MNVLPENGNFLFLPSASPGEGVIYLLGGRTYSYVQPCFTAVRYSEPRLLTPAPEFYPILDKHQVTGIFQSNESAPLEVFALTSKAEYLDRVRALREHIQRGDIYEINFCIRFEGRGKLDPYQVFCRLCEAAAAPYQMLARLEGEYVLCASPELFLQKRGTTLLTKPIKGTMRRAASAQVDEMLRTHLSQSPKERTENVMAVDVARNDLSMIAARGTVEVPSLFAIESFKTVHQMVSSVQCTIRGGVDFQEIMRATFPMASMTGAPKTRAMQLIGQHENFSRDLYSGTMGLIDEHGDFTLPVLIRSLFYNASEQKFWFATGGAITFLSEPSEEYDECLLKAGTMMRALNGVLRT